VCPIGKVQGGSVTLEGQSITQERREPTKGPTKKFTRGGTKENGSTGRQDRTGKRSEHRKEKREKKKSQD